MINIHKLDNGLTVILDKISSMNTATVLVGVKTGSIYEEGDEHGLAHFFEHMCFKGTKKYILLELLRKIDGKGLMANAFTSTDRTAYYLSGNCKKIKDMIDITGDIFLNSTFPAEEMEKEKGVILQEIDMYENDSGSNLYQKLYNELLRGTPMGHNVIGTKESVKSFTREQFISFLEKHYFAENTIVSIAGNFDENEVLEQIKEIYKDMKRGKTYTLEVNPKKIENKHLSIVKKEDKQLNLIMASVNAPKYTDKDSIPFLIANTVLGGGGKFSSRLFLKIREEMGECYGIYSHYSSSAYIGKFEISTGIDVKSTEKVVKAIVGEIKKLKEEGIPEKEIEETKSFIIGGLSRRSESTYSRVCENFFEYANSTKVKSLEEKIEKINSTKKEDVEGAFRKYVKGEDMMFGSIGNEEIKEDVSNSLKEI